MQIGATDSIESTLIDKQDIFFVRIKMAVDLHFEKKRALNI